MHSKLSGAATVAALIAAFMSSSALAQTYTLKLGTVLAPEDPLVVAAQGMKKAIEERSKGDFTVEIYPSSQLGDTQDMMDQAAAGANVGTFIESSRVSGQVPQFAALAAPYVFKAPEEIAKFAESKTFSSWNDELRGKTGLTLLSFNWYQGARNLLTKKPITGPADLQGVRMRTIDQPVWMATINAMGANAAPLSWAEVHPSLQAGVIDGAEAQPSAIWGAKLYEVVSHVTLSEHIYLMSGLVVGDKWVQSLPENYQQMVREEAVRWGAEAMKANIDGATEILKKVSEKGVTVSEVDKEPFRKAVEPVYEQLGMTDYIKQVRAELHD